jgi:DNA-binding response OmpR family regulator
MSDTENNLVLVADDEPSTRELVVNHLLTQGYRVIEASDGDEAWALANEHLPNLIILDVMMPGMSGWEVCRRVREEVSLAHTGVIMLTGIGEHLNAMTSPLYGADAYVDKPFEFTDLDEKVQDTLRNRSRGTFGRPDGADLEPSSGPTPDSIDYLSAVVPEAPLTIGLPGNAQVDADAFQKKAAGTKTRGVPAEAAETKVGRKRLPSKTQRTSAKPKAQAKAKTRAKSKPKPKAKVKTKAVATVRHKTKSTKSTARASKTAARRTRSGSQSAKGKRKASTKRPTTKRASTRKAARKPRAANPAKSRKAKRAIVKARASTQAKPAGKARRASKSTRQRTRDSVRKPAGG